MKYKVNLTNKKTGTTITIDAKNAPEGYTAEQYIKDSKINSWDSWNEMLEDENNEITLIAIEETPTIKELVETSGMTQTEFADHFEIPLRSVQNWIGEKRKCPEYVRKMIAEILENEKKDKLEVTFSENTKKCLELMLPCANTMYRDCYYDFRTPEDIVRYALSCIMEEITAEYGEYVIDDKYGTVNQIFFPNMKNPLYIIDK